MAGKRNKGLSQTKEKQGLVLWWIFDESDGPWPCMMAWEEGKEGEEEGRGLSRAPVISPAPISGGHGSKKISKMEKKEGRRREEGRCLSWDPLEGEVEFYRVERRSNPSRIRLPLRWDRWKKTSSGSLHHFLIFCFFLFVVLFLFFPWYALRSVQGVNLGLGITFYPQKKLSSKLNILKFSNIEST